MLKELYDAEATSGGREFQSLRTEGKNEYIKLFVLTGRRVRVCACMFRNSKGLSLGVTRALGKSTRPFTILYIMQSFIRFLRAASVGRLRLLSKVG